MPTIFSPTNLSNQTWYRPGQQVRELPVAWDENVWEKSSLDWSI